MKLLATFDRHYDIASYTNFSRIAIPSLYAIVCEIPFSANYTKWNSTLSQPTSGPVRACPIHELYTVPFIDSSWQSQSRLSRNLFLCPRTTLERTLLMPSEALMQAGRRQAGIHDSWQRQRCHQCHRQVGMVKTIMLWSFPQLGCHKYMYMYPEVWCICWALGVAQMIVSTFSMSWKRHQDLPRFRMRRGFHSNTW